MKKIEYITALALIVVGLICLTMSGVYLLEQNIKVYAITFIKLCIWIGIPLSIIGLVYFFFLRRKKEKSY